MREVLIVRQQSWMNRSGEAVAALMGATGSGPVDLLVVCYALYLDFGALRSRARGSDGGHNGLASVIEAVGTRDFPRLRVGVGPAEAGVTHADYVLAPFTRDESRALPKVIERAASGAALAPAEGIGVALNRVNRRGVRAEAGP